MGLPALYYSGRDNPPHPEIWIGYFLRMVELYSTKVRQLSVEIRDEDIAGGRIIEIMEERRRTRAH